MATTATASTVIPLPIETVWKVLREFGNWPKLLSGVTKVELEDGANQTTVGALRTIHWEGQWRSQRLRELSDLSHTAIWDLVATEPIAETSGQVSTLKCFRITSTNQTLVSWTTDFSAEVQPSLIKFESAALAAALADLVKGIKA
jgi:hypothetical protein